MKMSLYGISIKDLKTENKICRMAKAAPAAGSGKAKSNSNSRLPVKVKYRGSSGQAWTGRRLTPKWLQTEISVGKTKADFLVPKGHDKSAE